MKPLAINTHSHFLHNGTPLDVLARERATTTYLVQECYPMLPRVLSEQLCRYARSSSNGALS
jgi:exoribonuclease R